MSDQALEFIFQPVVFALSPYPLASVALMYMSTTRGLPA